MPLSNVTTEPAMPASLEVHQPDYHANVWQQWSTSELGQWVHLLNARARHRKNETKARKDLQDARNYLDMLKAQLDATESYLNLMYKP